MKRDSQLIFWLKVSTISFSCAIFILTKRYMGKWNNYNDDAHDIKLVKKWLVHYGT